MNECEGEAKSCLAASDIARIEALVARELISVKDDRREYLQYERFLNSNPYTLPHYAECIACSDALHGCPPRRDVRTPRPNGSTWDEVFDVYCWREERALNADWEWETSSPVANVSGKRKENRKPILSRDRVGIELTSRSDTADEANRTGDLTGGNNGPTSGSAKVNKSLAEPPMAPPTLSGHLDISEKNGKRENEIQVTITHPWWIQIVCIFAAAIGFFLGIKWGCDI